MQVKINHIKNLHILNYKELINQINNLSISKKQYKIILLDASLFIKSIFDKKLKKAINEANLVLPKGKILTWTLKSLVNKKLNLNKKRKNQNINKKTIENYCNFPMIILRNFEKSNNSFFFLGGSKKYIKQSMKYIIQAFPKAIIRGFNSKQYIKKNANLVISKIRKTNPNIIILDLKNGYQEKWISTHKNQLPNSIYITSSNFINIFAGKHREYELLKQILNINLWQSIIYNLILIIFSIKYRLFYKKNINIQKPTIKI